MPGQGFKVADAYADFHIDVDSEIGRAAARLKAEGAEFARMGENAGKAFSAGFAKGVDLDKGFTKEVEKLRARTNQLTRMGNQAGEGYGRGFGNGVNLRGAMVEQLAVVRSSRAAFGNEGKQAGQAYARGFGNPKLSGPSVSNSSGGAEASGEAQARAMARGFQRGSGDMDSSVSKVAARTEAKFSALKFLGLSQGLPAAAAVGVGATAAVIGGAGLIFAGLGVSAQLANQKVQQSVVDTAETVGNGINTMSGTYEQYLLKASDNVEKSFLRSSGAIQKGMNNSAYAVDSLTTSALMLGENALPGIVTASGRLGPVLEGVRSLSGAVGQGFSEMAENASQGSDGARVGLVILGDTLRTVEARVGTIAANFANASAGPLNSFRYTLDQVTGALVDASAQGSAVNGFLGGFTTSTNGAITVARGLFTVINALPPQVAQLGGAVASTSMIMSRLGVDAGAGWEGLGGKIRNAGKDLAGTEKFAAKAGTAVGGLAAGALNPAALAVGALSLGLLILGDAQEKAAAAAAEHRENVRQLTDAIRQDNGVLAEHSAVTIANALATKNARENLAVANVTMADATTATMGNERAMFRVADATNHWIQGLADQGIVSQRNADGLKGINKELLENGGNYAGVATEVSHFNQSMSATNKEAQEQLVHLLNGTGALGEQAKAAREAYSGYLLQQQGLTNLTEAQIKARDATVDHTKAILDQQNASLGYRGAVQASKEAIDAYNKVVKDGKLNTDEGVRATLAMEQALSQQEQAAYNAAYANAEGKSDAERAAIATQSLTQETINLANAFAGPLPASLQTTIGKMNATQAQAAGVKLGINQLGQAVYILPNGKQILIESNADQQAARMANLRDQINSIPTNKKSTVEIVTIYKQVGTAAVRTGNNAPDVYLYGPHAAAGGLLAEAPIRKFSAGGLTDIRGGGLVPGSGGTRQDNVLSISSRGLVATARGEYVTPEARVNQRTLPLLEAIRSGNQGLISAASEALDASRHGQTLYEDLSFKGQSANGGRYNDKLAAMYYAQTGRGFETDASTQSSIAGWLQSFITQSTAAMSAIPSTVAAAMKRLPPSAPINVTAPPAMDLEALAAVVSRLIMLRGK